MYLCMYECIYIQRSKYLYEMCNKIEARTNCILCTHKIHSVTRFHTYIVYKNSYIDIERVYGPSLGVDI